MDRTTGKVLITAHNHGFSVDADSLPDGTAEITHVNLNDGTVEGLALRSVPAIAVQYHPEGSPGPHEAALFFESFCRMIHQWREAHGHAQTR